MYFKNIIIYVDGIAIIKNINFKIYGISNLLTDSHDKMSIFFNTLFKKRNAREEDLFVNGEIYVGGGKEEGLFIDGKVYLDNKQIYKIDFPILMSRYKLFNKAESVSEALYMICPERANMVLNDFEIKFGDCKLCDLGIEQRRIFEILIEMVEIPKLVFISSIELKNEIKKKYLHLIKKYIKIANSVCLIQTEEDKDIFDGTLIAKDKNIFSLNKKKYRKYHLETFFKQIDIYPQKTEDKIEDEGISVLNTKIINDKNINVEITQKLPQLHLPKQLFDTVIYKAQLRQSRTLAFLKYNLMIRKYTDKINIYKNIGVFVILMLFIRAYQEINRELIRVNIPSVLCFFFSFLLYFYDFKIFFILIFFLKFIFQELSWNRIFELTYNIFKNSYTLFELKIVTSFVYFCIFFGGSTIMVEDRIFLRYYTPFLITPGTYIVSVFLYLLITQFIAFLLLGFIFNIKSIFITSFNAVIVNIAIACATTKRLRETFISIFIVLYFFISIIASLYSINKNIFFYFFPLFLATEVQYSGMSIFKILLITSPYYALIYIISCYRVAFLAHKAF